jgi:hypothetical protein
MLVCLYFGHSKQIKYHQNIFKCHVSTFFRRSYQVQVLPLKTTICTKHVLSPPPFWCLITNPITEGSPVSPTYTRSYSLYSESLWAAFPQPLSDLAVTQNVAHQSPRPIHESNWHTCLFLSAHHFACFSRLSRRGKARVEKTKLRTVLILPRLLKAFCIISKGVAFVEDPFEEPECGHWWGLTGWEEGIRRDFDHWESRTLGITIGKHY